MSNPRILLLDEPYIGVAPMAIQEIEKVLAGIASTGVGILLVEQNVHRALAFAERGTVIENGSVALAGSRHALLADPKFGTKFLGLE